MSGSVRMKEKTVDPAWKKDDGNQFELPPLWTDYDVPHRGAGGKQNACIRTVTMYIKATYLPVLFMVLKNRLL